MSSALATTSNPRLTAPASLFTVKFFNANEMSTFIAAKLKVSENDITLYHMKIEDTFILKCEGIRAQIDVIWTPKQLLEDLVNAVPSSRGALAWSSARSAASTEYDSGDSKDCEYIYDHELLEQSKEFRAALDENDEDIDDFMRFSLDDNAEEFDAGDESLDFHGSYLLWFQKVIGNHFLGMPPKEVRTIYESDLRDARSIAVEISGELLAMNALEDVLDLLANQGYDCQPALQRLAALP